MEKFTKWDDKATGINPFLPQSISSNPMWKNFIILPIRFCYFLIMLTFFFAIGLKNFFLTKFFIRIVLFLFGFWYINFSIADTRKIQLGGKQISNTSYADVKPGAIILCNSTNFFEILILEYLYSPDFYHVHMNKGKIQLREHSFFSSIQHSRNLNQFSFSEKKSGKSFEKFSDKAVNLVFPDVVNSNGKAILSWNDFSECFDANLWKDHKVHLMGFGYSLPIFGSSFPCHTSQSTFSILISRLLSPHFTKVTFLHSEYLLGKERSLQMWREMLARVTSLSWRNTASYVKLVNLGSEDFINYINFVRKEKLA
eukprot:snap_masked-scaffold_1-processed-gene-3.10-mRNA-1 protein AED:1.00 eAED:1.00 QI:0/0/0/0/1/1/2/0/311